MQYDKSLNGLGKKLVMIIMGLLLSFQMLHADEERSVTLNAGYNAVQFDANVTLEYLVEKIGFENLIGIQGAGQGSAYKKSYVDDGLDFLNSFSLTAFGKAYWINVGSDVTFTYVPEVYSGSKNIDLVEGWNFVGPIDVLSLAKIQEQLGMDNLLVIQGAGQGKSYKKSYIDDGTPFLNSFTAFEQGQGYWVKVTTPASLSFVFGLGEMAKDNTFHNAEIIKTIAGQDYTIGVYSDTLPTSETSQSTIAVYGEVNGEMVILRINDTYPTSAKFQVIIVNGSGVEMALSEILNFNISAIEFLDITI